jgi:Cu(I)/Ag(I) efflux system membrane protein CusA/SilA
MPRRNFAAWSFSALLIAGAGLFPLQAVFGVPYKTCFLVIVGLTMTITIFLIAGWRWQLLAFATLGGLALAACNFPKIGTDYMPPLDEGSILDMPVTVPRVSVTEAAADLKTRDSMIRQFPEIELIVGKAGRADTPTDPSPLDMVESVITLRPKENWPKRKLDDNDARRQTAVVLDALQKQNLIQADLTVTERHALIDLAAMNAAPRFDAAMREMVLVRFKDFDAELGPALLREFIAELAGRLQKAGRLTGAVADADVTGLTEQLEKEFAPVLAAGPGQEDINRLMQKIVEKLAAEEYGKKLAPNPKTLAPNYSGWYRGWLDVAGVLGAKRPTLYTDLWQYVVNRRERQWRTRVAQIDGELPALAAAAYDRLAIDELRKAAEEEHKWVESSRPHPNPLPEGEGTQLLDKIRADLDVAWSPNLYLARTSKDDLVKELDNVVCVPGWSNIWTQPIINRINMLATGVRTEIGVKVFGDNLDQIQKVSDEVAETLKGVPGAVDVVADQNNGKGYLEIRPDRDRAARYGVNVGDIWDVVEVALGGKAITTTVEGRQRFPIRIRYGRAFRQDEEDVKNLLINAGSGMAGEPPGGMGDGKPLAPPARGAVARQIPLSMVADVRIVEGPAMIKSENGRLRSYVQLNVRDRDVVGFVEEAQRAVAQKVKLPQGASLAWSGEFENQVRAQRTMLWVLPVVILIIFVILYLTYKDLTDALLMMMCVPEALVGGVFLLWFFGYHYSVAVQVGFIACLGMATETGIIMLVYLREAIENRGGLEKIGSLDELRMAVIEGAVHRLRPKLLTEGVAIIALAPMLWASGVGREIVSAMAAPVLGGLLIADEVVDIFIPVRFYWARRRRWLKMRGVK